MNIFHSFCKSLYSRTEREAKLRGIFVCLYFFCLAQFTLFVYKSLIIVVENLQKYHWIQHEKTQRVVVTRGRHKLLWTSETKNRPFSIISSWGKHSQENRENCSETYINFRTLHVLGQTFFFATFREKGGSACRSLSQDP